MRRFVPLLLGVALCGTAFPAWADPIGLVQKLQNAAYGTPPEAAKVAKQPTDGIEFNELIETVRKSAIQIGFVDGSSLTLGADAAVKIDAFVFDSDSETGQAAFTLSRGTMRWVTGILPPSGIRIETPTASIAIRGTILKIGLRPNGDTILALIDGEVTATSRDSNASADLEAGQSALITRQGVEVLDEILSVADAVIDDGWSRAENFRTGRGRDPNGGNNGNSN